MKNKRVLAALLIAAMTVGLTACGGSSDSNGSAAGTETGSTKADGDYEQVTYAYSTFNNIPTEEDLDVVEEEINKITREKIGVEVTFRIDRICRLSEQSKSCFTGRRKNRYL